MKKATVLLTFFSLTLAKEPGNIEMYRMGYSDGHAQGRQEGIAEGYKLAIEDFKKIFAEKLREYEEIEAGKFLIKEGRVSPPRVYTLSSGRIVVEGCRLLMPVDDLIARLPMRKDDEQEPEKLPITFEPIRPMVRVILPYDELKNLQHSTAVVYRKEGDKIIAYFETKEQAQDFCARSGKCQWK